MQLKESNKMWFGYKDADLMLALEEGAFQFSRPAGPLTIEELEDYKKLVNDLIARSVEERDRQQQNIDHLKKRAVWTKATIKALRKEAKEEAQTEEAIEDEVETAAADPSNSKSKRFVPPTVIEVTEYAKSINYPIDPNAFLDYYIARGWFLKGNVKMKNWRAAVRTWKAFENGRTNNGRASGVSEARFAARG